MNEFITSQSVKGDFTSQEVQALPFIEEVIPASDEELQQYRNKLRQFFINGEKTSYSLTSEIIPLVVAPFMHGRKLLRDFPALFHSENGLLENLYQVLQKVMTQNFDAVLLDKNEGVLEQIQSLIIQETSGTDTENDFRDQLNEILNPLLAEEVNSESIESLMSRFQELKDQVISKKAIPLFYSALVPFQLLNLHLKENKKRNQAFLDRLQNRISGINDLLQLQTGEAGSSLTHLNFASELISFDKITDMATPQVSSVLPNDRIQRLRQCLEILRKGYDSYSQNTAVVFVTKDLADEFYLSQSLSTASLEITNDRPGARAREVYKKEINEFVQIISALRIADLEIGQEYNEDLHTPYFDGFNLSYLGEEDIQFFRSLIVVDEARQLTREPKDFLAHLSYGDFIKVLAINRLEDLYGIDGHSEAEETYLELAAMAIFRRNAFVYQGAGDEPYLLNDALKKGTGAQCPVLWNILFPAPASDNHPGKDLLSLKAAVESRYFPRVVYDIHSGDDFAGHFDINCNPLPEEPFPTTLTKIKSSTVVESDQLSLTVADFWAMHPKNAKMIEIIPPELVNEDMVPLSAYITSDDESTAMKIPYILMVDDVNIVRKAAIPMHLVQRCRARLDYWLFFQEMSGVHSALVNNAVTEAKSKWASDKVTEIDLLKAKMHAEFDRTRSEDLEKAIERILNNLLNADKEITTLLEEASTSIQIEKEVTISKPEESIVEESKVEEAIEEKVIPRSEAWIESDECTSCSDCIDALPGVFKYNSDKLAIVHNPKGGAYAKIVAAAEKCPARCIHPGLPQDANESGLEKLIKRAEKYN